MKDTEIEFKFEMSEKINKEEILSRLSERFVIISRKTDEIEDVYFDTRQFDLLLTGFSLRRRFKGEREIIDAKYQPIKQSGLRNRSEWVLWDGAKSNALTDDKILNKLNQKAGVTFHGDLAVLARLFKERDKYRLKDGDTEIELSVDKVTTPIKDDEEKFCFFEIELELIKGNESEFIDWGERFSADLGLKESPYSKLTRVLRHYGRDPRYVESPDLKESMLSSEAFFQIIEFYFRQAESRIKGVMLGKDPEYIHEYRVALRKSRTVIETFRPLIKNSIYLDLKKDFKEMFDITGAGREIDVFIDGIREYYPDGDYSAAIRLFEKAVSELKRSSLNEIIDYMKSGRFENIRHRFYKSLKDEQLVGLGHRLVLKRLIYQASRKQDKSLRKLIGLTLKNPKLLSKLTLHEIRIRFKQLRYTAGILPGLKDKKYYLNAKYMQEQLGPYVDMNIFRKILNHLEKKMDNGKYSKEMTKFISGIQDNIKSAKKEKLSETLKSLKAFV